MKNDTLQTINDVYIAIKDLSDNLSKEKNITKSWIEENQLIVGALLAFLGGALSFSASTIKDVLNKKKDREREYDNFKMNVYAELVAFHFEFSDIIQKRDKARMQHIDEFGTLRENKFTRKAESELSEFDIASNNLNRLNEEVRLVQAKFIKHLNFYLYKKKHKSIVMEYQSTLVIKGLNYIPEKFDGTNGLAGKILFQERRRREYENFHTENVALPLASILVAVRDDK